MCTLLTYIKLSIVFDNDITPYDAGVNFDDTQVQFVIHILARRCHTHVVQEEHGVDGGGLFVLLLIC